MAPTKPALPLPRKPGNQPAVADRDGAPTAQHPIQPAYAGFFMPDFKETPNELGIYNAPHHRRTGR
jgi:hypothetical protein